MHYHILEWDSDFFKMSIARIAASSLKKEQMKDVLVDLQNKGVKLVYWPAAAELEAGEARRLGGQLVDLKTTFVVDCRSVNLDTLPPAGLVEAYSPSMPVGDLEALAIQSGEYSRFAIDPQFPREKFIELYKIWIDNSLKKKIAKEVLVIREGERVIAMETLGEKNGRGDIGLIAVETAFRGRKYGETLVRSAQSWFIHNGYQYGQVVTQGKNRAACNLYRKCGFAIEKVEYYYHFWL